MTQSCPLCGHWPPDNDTLRSCGLDLCRQCYSGDLSERLAHRGWTFERKQWATGNENKHTTTQWTGRCATPYAIDIDFNRESSFTKFTKWFGHRDPEAGDPLFDDAVYVETITEDVTKRLLAQETFQMAVMDSLFELGTIFVKPEGDRCRVVVRYSRLKSGSQRPEPDCCQRLVAILMHCIEQLD